MTAAKVDLKDDDAYRAHRGEFRTLTVPERSYLAVDGHGDPNTDAFAVAVQALYPVAYALKFASKAAGRDYVVPPLEGLWWAQDMDAFTRRRDKAVWDWTLLLLVPDWLGADDVAAAVEHTRPKAPERLDDVRLEALTEGLCVQTLHVGPFDDEGPVLRELHHEVLPGAGFSPTGRHHEVYLSDPRRTDPAKQRTILRQPVG
ncbi:hypothetical protein SAMN03159343_2172 [Klenkia marina]|uniref:GyrI-like small molecule binding domain-containing protein n=1 Tax=Klenkia marina TaxID=1960309 RepID=A0A1G4Y7H9_9ACTN|nr:GyrI-like domain-containing protein [Klenkia marina]SCX49363.1 hypothetical protein SAMN03159343_2172 [Klenkia marina]